MIVQACKGIFDECIPVEVTYVKLTFDKSITENFTIRLIPLLYDPRYSIRFLLKKHPEEIYSNEWEDYINSDGTYTVTFILYNHCESIFENIKKFTIVGIYGGPSTLEPVTSPISIPSTFILEVLRKHCIINKLIDYE